jgi:xanthine dehydrogenase YagR molybdenum-binding subunit
VQTIINGRRVEFEPTTGKTALDVLRSEAGLTGTKLVCGAGVCGACTIRVDGTSLVSCLLPAGQLEGREVRTIEAVGMEGLHPVQKAFMASDGLQCGFCTPGFVSHAIDVYERWRATYPVGEAPSREHIARELSGHLCRCGSYVGIYEAVRRACAGELDGDAQASAPRVEAREKVTGEAEYTFDVRLPGQLEARFVRSDVAHARIVAIDTSRALALEGVRAVVQLVDPSDPYVRYVGAPVAAVAAGTLEVAQRAAGLVRVEYDRLPFVVDEREAVSGNVTAYEGRPRDPPNASEGPVPPARWRGNVRKMWLEWALGVWPWLAHRLVRKARTDPELELVSATYTTATQIHTALEPHVAVAEWRGASDLVVYVSTQTVDFVWRRLQKRFGLGPEQVRVVAHHVGGGFGAKQDLQIETVAAVELARAAGAPVRLANDRLEEMVAGGNRPAARIAIDVVSDRNGRFRALRLDTLGSAGIAVNSTIAVLARLVYHGPYKALDDRDVVTNLPPGKPFRAPYGPPFAFAMESSVDEMAHRLAIDPIELRRRWDRDRLRRRLYDWAADLEPWRDRGPVAASTARFRRGVGVAMGSWINTFYAGTVVEVSATRDGIAARTTAQDMGNGPRTVIADAVADVFGIDPPDVRVTLGETTGIPGPASSGSRTTNAVYTPSRRAAEKVRDGLVAHARTHLGLAGARAAGGGVTHAGGRLSWAELLEQVPPVTRRDRRGANGPFDILGRLPSGKLMIHLARPETGIVYVVEVVVDTRTGRVEVVKVWGGIAAGRIVCPPLARSQVEGGIIQGVGYALYEERHVDPTTGTVLSLGLEDYRIPGMGDTPEIELRFYEKGFEKLEGRAAGLSELATIPVAAAIANAVHHATGHRYTELPLRPDRILSGLA